MAVHLEKNTPRSLRLSVRDFAVPEPLTGSIDRHSGFGTGLQTGVELHQLVQLERAKEFDSYKSEFSYHRTIAANGWTIVLRGRLDGRYLTAGQVVCEEIKSSFDLAGLDKVLSKQPEHPYKLQALTYAYLEYLATGRVPIARLLLISSRHPDQRITLDLNFDLEFIEAWWQRRLKAIGGRGTNWLRQTKRRQTLAKGLKLPFESPRTGQQHLMDELDRQLQTNQQILIEAPTGLGKTVGVLLPALKDALIKGQQVIYTTPKNSQHRLAEDVVKLWQQQGQRVRSLTVTAKAKVCLKDEVHCQADYCEFARDYYTKVQNKDLRKQLQRSKQLTPGRLQKLGLQYEVCPFQLGLDQAESADVVISDYNYAVSPRAVFGGTPAAVPNPKKPTLVVDEIHNLPERATDYFSLRCSETTLNLELAEARNIKNIRALLGYRNDRLALLQNALRLAFDKVFQESSAGLPVNSPFLRAALDVTLAFEQVFALSSTIIKTYLSSSAIIEPNDPLLAVCYELMEFQDALKERQNETGPDRRFFVCIETRSDNRQIDIVCCDAAPFLKERWLAFEKVTGFSATLRPYEFYMRLSGLQVAPEEIIICPSPFPGANRRLLMIPQISTKLRYRALEAARIAETIERIMERHDGNYAAFFPSYAFQSLVLDKLSIDSQRIIRQQPATTLRQVDLVMKQLSEPSSNYLLAAVSGGIFAEGIDYLGNRLIGAFIVGPALPAYSDQRRQKARYFEATYGQGEQYAYIYPAMTKVVQALGRVIRSPQDRGLLVMIDGRFVGETYLNALPSDWLPEDPGSLISKSILSDVDEFWQYNNTPREDVSNVGSP